MGGSDGALAGRARPAECGPVPPPRKAGAPGDTRMSDGRHFTDWTPRGSGWKSGARYPHPAAEGERGRPLSSQEMKDRLVRDGGLLMEADRKAAASAVSRTWCDALELPGFETEQECGEFGCAFAPAPEGTGIGRRA